MLADAHLPAHRLHQLRGEVNRGQPDLGNQLATAHRQPPRQSVSRPCPLPTAEPISQPTTFQARPEKLLWHLPQNLRVKNLFQALALHTAPREPTGAWQIALSNRNETRRPQGWSTSSSKNRIDMYRLTIRLQNAMARR
jgi:hypothetical protein